MMARPAIPPTTPPTTGALTGAEVEDAVVVAAAGEEAVLDAAAPPEPEALSVPVGVEIKASDEVEEAAVDCDDVGEARM